MVIEIRFRTPGLLRSSTNQSWPPIHLIHWSVDWFAGDPPETRCALGPLRKRRPAPIRADAADLAEPEELATDAIAELEGAVKKRQAVFTLLANGYNGGKSWRATP